MIHERKAIMRKTSCLSSFASLSGRVLLLLLLSLPLLARAQNVTVNFTGDLQAGTCSVSAGSNTQTVNLGSHTAARFASVNATSDWIPFDIKLTNCAATVSKVSFRFGGVRDAEASNYYRVDNSGASGVAKGLAIHLTRNAWSSATYVPPGTTDTWDKRSDDTYTYAARLIRTGALAPGRTNLSLTITLSYS